MRHTPSKALSPAAVALWAALPGSPVVPATAATSPHTEAGATIDLEVLVAGDADTIYRLFATSEGVQTLFPGAGARIGEAVGDEYLVAFDPDHPEGNLDGTAGCRILALEPPRYISFQWRGPVWAVGMNVEPLPTWVEVDILPAKPEGTTRVRLRHHGFLPTDDGEWNRSFAFFSEGWGSMLRRLQARYENRLDTEPGA